METYEYQIKSKVKTFILTIITLLIMLFFISEYRSLNDETDAYYADDDKPGDSITYNRQPTSDFEYKGLLIAALIPISIIGFLTSVFYLYNSFTRFRLEDNELKHKPLIGKETSINLKNSTLSKEDELFARVKLECTETNKQFFYYYNLDNFDKLHGIIQDKTSFQKDNEFSKTDTVRILGYAILIFSIMFGLWWNIIIVNDYSPKFDLFGNPLEWKTEALEIPGFRFFPIIGIIAGYIMTKAYWIMEKKNQQ